MVLTAAVLVGFLVGIGTALRVAASEATWTYPYVIAVVTVTVAAAARHVWPAGTGATALGIANGAVIGIAITLAHDEYAAASGMVLLAAGGLAGMDLAATTHENRDVRRAFRSPPDDPCPR